MSFTEFFRGLFPRKPARTAAVAPVRTSRAAASTDRRNDSGDGGYPVYLHAQAAAGHSDKHDGGHHDHGASGHGHSHHSDGGWGGGDSGGGGGDGGGGGGD